ncbi:MAG: PAS domain S-box protein [Candidatus Melainabacteria bacterium]|nr:PAS domain S-box protein [Candidatus Melainabacteria bacterium]
MKFKLKFTRQILLIVCIPMLVQIMFVCLLALNIKQLEQCYNREAQAADYLSDSVKFLAQLIACAGVQALYQVSKDPKYLRDYKNKVLVATVQSENLRNRARADVGEHSETRELEDLFLSLKQASVRGHQAADSHDQVDQAVALFEMRGVLNRVNGVTSKIMGHLTEERREIAAAKLQAQNQIYTIIFVTIAANVLVLLLFIFRFDRTTSQRFTNLTENVMSLGANQKLQHRIGGNDDLAELDSVIHRVSNVMRDSRLKEQAIVKEAVDVICALDENGKFQQVNPAAERLWKFENDEILGKSLLSMVAPEERDRVHRTITQLIAQEESATFETNVITRDAQLIEMQWNSFFSREMKQIFCVAHDVTERKKVERLKAKLVEMISHDLRSPMSALQITLNILSSGSVGTLPDPVAQRVKRAELSLAQMVDMLDDFLELEKLDTSVYELDRHPVKAKEVVDLACNLIEELSTKRNLQIKTSVEDVSLVADKPRLVRVLTNLLSNAIKFSPEGSKIEMGAWRQGENVVFEVRDHGPGIAKEYQAAVFERFTQTDIGKKQSKGGVGLGLAVCKAIVDAHGGAIRVESEEGQGCRFILTLPFGIEES